MSAGFPDLGSAITSIDARHIRVIGLVQGVGFRPFVHRLALRFGLAGWVLNASGAVEIHVEGDRVSIDRFIDALSDEAPVLARIEAVYADDVEPGNFEAFEVRVSHETGDARLPVSPDVAMCDACTRELTDPANRRYRYPFITCTDCGPRFTVIERMPYDRERTTMRVFTQCPACEREYHDPADRRYHSETNSCPACGPALWFEYAADQRRMAQGQPAIALGAALIRQGGILAVRGLGGFHLAVDATNEDAVARLRHRKHREAKPLAVMVRSIDEARCFASINDCEAGLLRSSASPIVLVRTRARPRDGVDRLAPNVAPGLAHVGVMLAYTPLHRLLLDAVDTALVMTSGNLSDEPIATGIEEARERLRSIADGFLLHDREIVSRYDDSVVRVVDEEPVMLRRARGYAPLPFDLPVASPASILAVGPHLKNTLTLVKGGRAYMSQHIGDLEDAESLAHFDAAKARLQTLFDIRPEVVVRDLHPGYLSTSIAAAMKLQTAIPVQHHHAHIAAVMAEHGHQDPVIGVAYDGTGYGDDGNIWGSEILYADLAGYRRVGHLRYAPLPGGDIAARAPWRCALGYQSLTSVLSPLGFSSQHVAPIEHAIAQRQLLRRINTPQASSMGRLFDAVASILGLRQRADYEGQAAMELEALAARRPARPLPFRLTEERDGWVFDPLPMLAMLGARVLVGDDVRTLAAAFHETVVRATVTMVHRVSRRTCCNTVALGGGCFQNARLLSTLRRELSGLGFTVLVPRLLSPNDGSVSLGQAAIGAALLAGVTSKVAPSPTRTFTIGG